MLIYENKDKNLVAYPLNSSRWDDFEALFGERGACGGCWCMSWRLKKSVFEAQKGEGNRIEMKSLVERNEIIGVILYQEGQPIGWCAVAPRENYIRLENSRILKRIDDLPVWSITCLFISKSNRKKGIAIELVKAAIKYCEINGAQIVEAYPVVPYEERIPDAFIWTGVPSVFKEAGFMVAEKRSKWKFIMRYVI